MPNIEQRALDALRITDETDYDRRVKAIRLAEEEGVSVDFAESNLEQLEKERKQRRMDFSDAPGAADFYSSIDNASRVGDDAERFAEAERLLRSHDDGKFFGEHTLKVFADAATNLGTSMLRGGATLLEGGKDVLVQGGYQSLEGGRERYKQYVAEEARKKAAGESVSLLETFKEAENPYLFGEKTATPADVKAAFNEEDYLEATKQAGQFIYDTGVASIPQMITYFTPAGVVASGVGLTQNIAEEIARNKGEEVSARHMIQAAPWSTASILLDKYGANLMVKAGKKEADLLQEVAGDLASITARKAFTSAAKEGGKVSLAEGGTEFVQEILEYVGGKFGTEAKIDMAEAVEQGAWAFLAGSAMGGAVGTPAAYLNERERRIRAMKDQEMRNDFDSLRDQDLIDSVITRSQEFASTKRAPEVVEQFFQSVGGDKAVFVPQSVVRQAMADNVALPAALSGRLDHTGVDIRVPLGEFVTQIAPNPELVTLLRPHMRLREEGVSLNDIETRVNRPTIEAMMGKADRISRIEKENEEALRSLEDSLVATGMHSRRTAKMAIKMFAEYADRVSADLKRAGKQVEIKDVIERARLRFAGPNEDFSGKFAFENSAKEMVLSGKISKEDFEAMPEPEQKEMVARYNAAKPVEIGGLGLPENNTFSPDTGNIYRQAAYHGSPYRFDKFSLEHLGRGEGAQAFGFGLYFAGQKEVAEWYRETLAFNDNEIQDIAYQFIDRSDGSDKQAVRDLELAADNEKNAATRKLFIEAALWIREGKKKTNIGQLYKVEIPEDDTMLLWDEPLSKQPEKVRNALKNAEGKMIKESLQPFEDTKGTGIYRALIQDKGSPKEASEYLHSLGINGIKYLDGTSRAKGEGAYNYVIFDDAAIQIVETFYQRESGTQAAIYNFPFGDRVIQFFKKQNLSSVFHEMSHLFLLMEADLARDFGVTPMQKELLDWLGVESFDDIKVSHHEKFARTFEAYLFEGKAPSLALADVFRTVKGWMVKIYEFVSNIPEAEIDPEIRSIFDRMLATEQKMEEIRANPAYDQYFHSKEEAGWSNMDWFRYMQTSARRDAKAKETVDEKLLKEWKRYRMKEWVEERNVIQDNEEAILRGQPLYRAIDALKEKRLDRAQIEQLMGIDLAAEKEPKSLLEFAKTIGGLSVDSFVKHGVDPADMKDFPRGTFTKDGKTLAQFAEAAVEEGYIVGQELYSETGEEAYDDNDVLELVMQELRGEKVYTSEGQEYYARLADEEQNREAYIEEHGEYPPKPEETEQEKMVKKLKRMTKKEGIDIALFAQDMGFASLREMVERVLSAKPIREQAKENAQAAMVEKYGNSMTDEVLTAEIKEAINNDEEAEMLLMEIRALNRKAKRPDTTKEYIKQKARDLISTMRKKDMRPNDYYRQMVKAAERSKKVNAEAAKINAALAEARSKAADELMAEVSDRAKEAKAEYDKAKKEYEDKQETARDVNKDKANIQKKYYEAKKASEEAGKLFGELTKATEKAKKKAAKKPDDMVAKAEYEGLKEKLDAAKKEAAKAEKEADKLKRLVDKFASDYQALFEGQRVAKAAMDNQKRIMEEQGLRLEEKTGRAAELKTEAGKKILELEKELERVSKEAADAKTQQLANHYLFKESTEAAKKIDSQVRYLRKVKTKAYNPKEVDPEHVQWMKRIVNLYDMKHYKVNMTAEERAAHQAAMDKELALILNWYESQVMSEKKLNELDEDAGGTGNRTPLIWMSEDLLAALAAKKEMGPAFTYKLMNMEDMTAGQIQGLYDTIRNIRLVGGRVSENAKAEYQKELSGYEEEVKANAGKPITRTMEPVVGEGIKSMGKEGIASMRNLYGIFNTLAGMNSESPLNKKMESVVDAVNRHITLEHEFAKTINGIISPILLFLANPYKKDYTKADGKVWSLSNQARFILLLNLGNQSNIDAVLTGLNAQFGREMGEFTLADLHGMVSGMGPKVLNAANKIWEYKDTVIWPLSSAIQRKVDGVTTAKIEPVPFVIDGVKMTGGHYRLHYMPLSGEGGGREFMEEPHNTQKIHMSKTASQFERVGSGGRAVDLGHFHLYRDIDEELRFIAYKELSNDMSRLFKGKNNPLRAAIVDYYGKEYMANLEKTIDGIVRVPVLNAGIFATIGRYVRSNMVYAFLAFSLRNVMQATYSLATGASQLGGMEYVVGAFLRFYSNPMQNYKEVHESSAYMRDRIVFINNETMTQMSRLSIWSPLAVPLKKIGWFFHAAVDGMMAYPYWMEAKRQYLRDTPVTKDTDFKKREKAANDHADNLVKQVMGSGHPLDVGSAFTNPDELHKNLVFMGAFANTTYNANAHNVALFKSGKIPWYELTRRLGWYTVLGPAMVMAVLGQIPDEDDEEFWQKIFAGILGYNAGQVIGLNHVANVMLSGRGFELPMFQGLESAKAIGKMAGQVYGSIVEGEEMEWDAQMAARLVRSLSMLFPLFGASQWAKIIEGLDDDEQNFWGMLVEGKQR